LETRDIDLLGFIETPPACIPGISDEKGQTASFLVICTEMAGEGRRDISAFIAASSNGDEQRSTA
jgi:hypothetical protein